MRKLYEKLLVEQERKVQPDFYISEKEADQIIIDTFKKIITNKYRDIFAETALAYADSIIGKFDIAEKIRSLDWKGSWTDADTFIKQAEIIGSYNFFNPETARKLVDYIGKEAEYRLGREYSVVVYIKVGEKQASMLDLDTIKEITGADEVGWAEPFKRGRSNVLRVWWD